MMKMFGGTLVNTDHIVRIDRIPSGEGGTPRVRLTLTDGQTIIESAQHLERMECHGATIVPAPPGYNVITATPPDEEGGEWIYWLEPILAFAVPSDASAPIPVLIDGWKLDGDWWAIRHPSGRCQDPYDVDIETEEKWKEHIKADWARAQERRQAKG